MPTLEADAPADEADAADSATDLHRGGGGNIARGDGCETLKPPLTPPLKPPLRLGTEVA